ncbi:MAG: hypothetical protein [Wendovervirus sonii]|uniref:Lipoprotein n=1 Tax=phage Lak_Megaphage_Sonny TaxID=3109229 RepID=A0ABZ0Z4E0_9CAUD|nr:MAG: hypothetical protein [phage Lak_Megaphage_Sonny]
MKDKIKGLWWIWPLINSIAIILCFGCININTQIDNNLRKGIDENAKDIEKICYRLEKTDSVVVINNIYVDKKK